MTPAAVDRTRSLRTLAIDCGGSGIKGSVVDGSGQLLAERVRVATPYPLAPKRFLGVLAEIAGQLPSADRATVGMPGMIRHGRVVTTPHYVTVAGPHTDVDPSQWDRWRHFDVREAVARRLRLPTLVLNDAEVAGAGVAEGRGVEIMLTLGTGLGCAIFDDGHLLPHLELSRAPVRRGRIYDSFIGNAARKRLGDEKWSRRVGRALRDLRPMFEWDSLYLGGGNARRLRAADVAAIGPDVTLVPNSAGIIGGVAAWRLFGCTEAVSPREPEANQAKRKRPRRGVGLTAMAPAGARG